MSVDIRQSQLFTLLDSSGIRAITSSTNATPVVITATGHGLTTGDVVMITNHAVNTAANGTRKVTVLTANTFSIQDLSGNDVEGNGVGLATGVFAKVNSPRISVGEWRNVIVSVATDGGGDWDGTIKFAGSIQGSDADLNGEGLVPDFARPQSVDNMYDFLQAIDLEDESKIDGDTGIVGIPGDDYRQVEINTNGISWLSVVPTGGTVGEITIKMRGYTNQ